MKKYEIAHGLKEYKPRSAWNKGVKEYALDLIENLPEKENILLMEVEKYLLNNADSWSHYSNSGCSLCYDADIIKRVCTKKEREKALKNIGRMANSRETWLDVQTRALYQAARLIWNVANKYAWKPNQSLNRVDGSTLFEKYTATDGMNTVIISNDIIREYYRDYMPNDVVSQHNACKALEKCGVLR